MGFKEGFEVEEGAQFTCRHSVGTVIPRASLQGGVAFRFFHRPRVRLRWMWSVLQATAALVDAGTSRPSTVPYNFIRA